MKSTLISKKIHSFCLLNNDVIYSTLNNELIFNQDVIFKSDKANQELNFNDNIVYTNNIYGDSIEFDIRNKEIKSNKDEFLKYLDSDFRITSKSKKTLILDKTNKSVTIKPYRIFIFIVLKEQKKIVYYEGNNLTSTNLNIKVTSLIQDTDYLTFPLSILGTWEDGVIEKPYQISEFSGIYENTLVCTMNNGAVLILDIQNGEVKTFVKDAKVKGGIYQKEENSPIFLGLKHYTFIELNAETGEVTRQVDIQNELKKIGNIPKESTCWLSVGTSIYQEGLFYFYADNNLVGVFDPISEKIIDYHMFEFDKKQYQQLKGGTENLQVKDNKIYCLDSIGNLYKLERFDFKPFKHETEKKI